MSVRLRTISDVAKYQLCCGCGVCSYVAPAAYHMEDVPAQGRRPVVFGEEFAEAVAACPGISLEHRPEDQPEHVIRELTHGWGPILELWEGHAVDPKVRHAGSSGGIATALAAFALDQGMNGVLHTAARKDAPHLNQTVFSTTREAVLEATGSRYAPASPCDGLAHIESADGPCVFIGKPCDVAGARKAAELRPKFKVNLGLTIAIFCAGTPSTQGTLEMLKRMGVPDTAKLKSLRYRGNGWPGKATAVFSDEQGVEQTRELTYEESWGKVLARHVQWRCRICPDHTGEFADIAVGDPWHKPPREGEPGRSLIVIRTARGREFLAEATRAGHVHAERISPASLPDAQPNLLCARGAVWGRLATLRLLDIPVPEYRGFLMFRWWCSQLGMREKAKSVFGTFRRARQRRLR